jgi:DNA-binding transcriptional ArsR family regulator
MPTAPTPPPLIDWFAALSDPVRLRILRLLSTNELSVGELAKSLQLPQSTVSRHLKVLNENGWIVKWSEGTTSRYRLDPSALSEPAQALWALTSEHLRPDPEQHDQYSEDDRRMAEVLAERRGDGGSFFGRIGGEAGAWDALRAELYGQMFTTEAMLGLLPASWTIADLGCGTGNCAELLSPIVKKVIAMDRDLPIATMSILFAATLRCPTAYRCRTARSMPRSSCLCCITFRPRTGRATRCTKRPAHCGRTACCLSST